MAKVLPMLKRKVIIINSLKGGVGKSTIAFCIIKYLSGLKKNVKVFDFDGLNRGLSATINHYLPKKSKHYVETDGLGSVEFFSRSMAYVSEVYPHFDYVILDGHIFPGNYVRVQKMLPRLISLVYIVPDDYTIHEDDLRSVVNQYTIGVKKRLIFLFNCKNNDVERLTKFRKIVEAEVAKTCKAADIDLLDQPRIHPVAIGHYSNIVELFDQYELVSEVLFEPLRNS